MRLARWVLPLLCALAVPLTLAGRPAEPRNLANRVTAPLRAAAMFAGAVTPDNGTATVAHNTSGVIASFTVTNDNIPYPCGPDEWIGCGADLFTMTCSVSGVVTGCSVDSPVAVDRWGATTVDVTYNVDGLGGGEGSLWLTASDGTGSDDGLYVVTATDTRLKAVIASLDLSGRDPHNGDSRDVSLCAMACFDAVASYSTPAYVSGDVPRSVTLVYRSSQARPIPIVQVDVQDNSQVAAESLSIKVMRPDASFVDFANGTKEMFFRRGAGWNRLAAQFDATTLTTGIYNYTVVVRSHWAGQTPREATAPIRVLVVNEKDSPFGWGWSLAGLQRVHVQGISGRNHLMVIDGAGSAVYFGTDWVPGTYTPPSGEFSVMKRRTTVGADGIKYERVYPDSLKYLFTTSGQLKYVVTRFNDTTKYDYDASGRLETITDSYGKTITFGYGTDGKLDWIYDSPGGRYTYADIDPFTSNLTKIVDPEPNSPYGAYALLFTYDGYHRMLERYDRAQKPSVYRYDFAGKVAADSTPNVDLGSQTVPVKTLLRSPETARLVDPATTAGSAANPAPYLNSDSVEAQVTDPEGNLTRYRLDRWGQPTRVIDPLGNVTTIARSGILPAVIKYPTTAVDSFVYDGPRLTYEKRAGKEATHTHYGAFSQPDTIWGNNQPTQIFYLGTRGRVDSVRLGSTRMTRYYYNARFRADSLRDQQNHVTRFHYHGLTGNLDSTLAPAGRWAKSTFDGAGRTTSTEALGQTRQWVQYDVLNRVTKTWHEGVTPVDTIWRYHGRAFTDTAVKDAKGQVYKRQLNVLGWPVRVDDPDATNGYIPIGYNRNGWVTSSTNRRGEVLNLLYDAIGRVTKKWGTNTTTDSVLYTPNGLQVVGINSVSRDEIYRRTSGWTDSVVTRIAGRRFRVQYIPDSRERLDSVDIKDSSGAITFANRRQRWNGIKGTLDTIRFSGNAVRFTYNTEYLQDTTVYPTNLRRYQLFTTNHEPFLTNYNNLTLQYAFWRGYGLDSLGRITSVNRPLGSLANYEIQRYRYDGVGRMIADTTKNGGAYCADNTDYGFTGGICATAITPLVTYDAVGNVASWAGSGGTITTSYATGNRLAKWNSDTVLSDKDGNRTSKGAGAGKVAYTWTSDNRLTSVAAGGDTVQFDYNAFGQVVRRSRQGTVERHYLWAADQLLAELDATATARIAEYVYRPGTDKPLALVTGAATITKVRYFEQDQLGNVVGIFGTDNVVSQELAYTARGDATVTGTMADTSRLRWKGLMWEGAPAKLYYMRARWYDPETGRFLTEDPVGLAGGINLYVFGSGDPINRSDPSGTCDVYQWEGELPVGIVDVGGSEAKCPNGQNSMMCEGNKTERQQCTDKATVEILKYNEGVWAFRSDAPSGWGFYHVGYIVSYGGKLYYLELIGWGTWSDAWHGKPNEFNIWGLRPTYGRSKMEHFYIAGTEKIHDMFQAAEEIIPRYRHDYVIGQSNDFAYDIADRAGVHIPWKAARSAPGCCRWYPDWPWR